MDIDNSDTSFNVSGKISNLHVRNSSMTLVNVTIDDCRLIDN